MKPFLKWAGGKRQLLEVLKEYIKDIGNGTYYEPFLGGGSLLLSMARPNCVINDFNEEIINVYEVVKSHPKKLINELRIHDNNNSKDYFYKIREQDREKDFKKKYTAIQRAARTIYLNKTCYNGLYRVNSKGFFNVPYGKNKNPLICDEENILEVSHYLNTSNITIFCGDFSTAVKDAKGGDYIYFDPPYDSESKSGFVGYIKEGFTRDDLRRLKEVCDSLILRDCKVLISNNDTEFVRQLFSGANYRIIYQTRFVDAKRSINCKGNERNTGKEILIYGELR